MEQKCPQCGAPLPSGVLAGLCPACLFKQGAAGDTVAPEAAGFQPPSVAEVARLFPQLEIIALLGKGGMGAVYQARQPALDRIVALKILPAQTAAGPGFVERFNREARALARLNHPNIVAVYEFGQVNGLSFFIMEFVDGLNLRELERAGKLSPKEALQIVPQICEALQFAHDEGIVHRDIKPENILLDKKGRVKIADFGIAKILGGNPEVELTKTGGAIGTPHYMAPEQMEKPTTVDHRADIFSLGVVFYEMLTGELPLGKFGPPSSRKIQVDVRLDDVVLRALEKDPEMRYQHASQVKTAVDTIAGSALPPPPANNGAAIAREILDRDYTLSIRSCIRRAWALLKGEFWPFVGITALIIALLWFASLFGGVTLGRRPAGSDATMQISSVLAMLVSGPLMGGLMFYFLKKIRREPATVETAFCGFSRRFLHLFLAGFVSSLLIWIGFLCLALPGIYLLVAWVFTLPLVVDKQLDFWSAMELSRKVVTRHWFKLLGFVLVMYLLMFAGLLALGFGVFVAAPLVVATFMYAYEDIFGGVTGAAAPPLAAGPSGTVVMPVVPPKASPSRAGAWALATILGLALVFIVIAVVFIGIIRHNVRVNRQWQRDQAAEVPTPPAAPQVLAEDSALAAPKTFPAVFGPVIEQELPVRASGANQFFILGTQMWLTPPPEIIEALTPSASEDNNRAWEGLDIPQDSHRFQYVRWLQENGPDLMCVGDGKIVGFDGIFSPAHGDNSSNWDDLDALDPEQARAAVGVVSWGRLAAQARSKGEPPPPGPDAGGIYNSAAQLDSREPGGPVVNLLTRDQSVNWYFQTRSGCLGVLQLAGFTGNPPVAKIRYKLVSASGGEVNPAADGTRERRRESLAERLDAASNITDVSARNAPLSRLALDAAQAGEVEIAKKALSQMTSLGDRNSAAQQAVRALAARGLRKPAIDIAKGISDFNVRNQMLAELAK